MFKNYLTIAFRNIKRQKVFSIINISGLAIGMTCTILILLWVQEQLSFDKFHDNADRIYRVTRLFYNQDGAVNLHLRQVAPPIGPLLQNDFPEIIHSIRTFDNSRIVSYQDKHFEESNFVFADADIFKVFTFNMIKGNPETALQDPFTVVITEEMVQKYFEGADPIGKVIRFESDEQKGDLKVTGVIKKLPHNSHFRPDFLASFNTLNMISGQQALQDWSSNNYNTYLLMPPGYDISRLQNQLDDFIDRHLGVDSKKWTRLQLQNLTDIHLESHYEGLYILSAMAFFILLIACINFMNLATARSTGRAKEVGIRKVVGANRNQVIKQFMSESILMAFLALLFALVFVELVLPGFNTLFYSELSFNITENTFLFCSLFVIALFVGLMAGSYPALYLSAFLPSKVLKGSLHDKSGRRFSFRTALVVSQFTISIILICSVGIVNKQMDYIQKKELGFNKDHLIVIPSSQELTNRLEAVKHDLLQHPDIVSISAAKRVPPGRLADSWGARVLSGQTFEPTAFRIALLMVDHDYIPTLEIKMAAGRNFSKQMPTDSTQAFILNETAVKKIGWQSPQEAIGKGFEYGSRKGKIVGVVKDLHFEPLHNEIAPFVMLISASDLELLSIRIRPDDIAGTIGFLEKKWQEYHPDYPFRYRFLDDQFDEVYIIENIVRQIFSYAAFLAIFIACLGLFGLASYTAEKRTREIGIRKVFGATVSGIVLLLTKKITKWILIANIIAWPIAYFLMSGWLQFYAYRTNIGYWTFLLSGVLAVIIALMTVSYQAIKAALANPVEALRYE